MSKNTKTRLPAELFKLAIVTERYHYRAGMCVALIALETIRAITSTERLLATEEIIRYMSELREEDTLRTDYLREALESCDLPHDEEATTAIYLDWDNRPRRSVEDD